MTFMPDGTDLASALAGYGKRTNPYDARRKAGLQLIQQGSDTSPILSPWQGAARLAQAISGGLDLYTADRDEKVAQTKLAEQLAGIESIADPKARLDAYVRVNPELGMRYGAQLAVEQAKLRAQQGMLQSGPSIGAAYGAVSPGGATGAPTALSPNATAISGIESRGQPNDGYGAVGPPADAKGSRAIGKYQVMDYNVGPWTQEVLGRPMTPQEFLANPDAQNKVFEAKFGQYVTKYGSPQAASRAWFAGEGGMNNPNARDVNGMTPVRYEQQFNQNLPPEAQGAPPMQTPPRGPGLQIDMPGPRPVGGAAPPLASGQGAGDGMPPQPTPQGVSGPAVVAPPPVPDVPRPQPTQAQIAKYDQLYRSGEFGIGPEARNKARAALEAELNQQWRVDRERRKLEYTQQLGDYQQGQKQRGEFDTKVATELAAKRIDNFENKVRPAAISAVNDIGAIHSVRQVLDSGAFTGTGAEAKTFLAKLGEQLGIPSEQATNTQVLGAVLAKRVLTASGGTLGTGFSNADRDFVERASGGQLSMDEAAMRRLADIGERSARQTIKQYGEEAGRVQRMHGVSQAFDPEHFAIPDAPTYAEWSKANPLAAPQAAPAAGNAPAQGGGIAEGATATNPKTGQKIMFRGGQWVPAQ